MSEQQYTPVYPPRVYQPSPETDANIVEAVKTGIRSPGGIATAVCKSGAVITQRLKYLVDTGDLIQVSANQYITPGMEPNPEKLNAPATEIQLKILAFIRDHMAMYGQAPSRSEIAEHVGLKAPSNAHYHILQLQAKGLLTLKSRRRRNIELAPKSTSHSPGIARTVAVCLLFFAMSAFSIPVSFDGPVDLDIERVDSGYQVRLWVNPPAGNLAAVYFSFVNDSLAAEPWRVSSSTATDTRSNPGGLYNLSEGTSIRPYGPYDFGVEFLNGPVYSAEFDLTTGRAGAVLPEYPLNTMITSIGVRLNDGTGVDSGARIASTGFGLAAIPAPAAAWLFLAGLAGFAGFRFFSG